MKKNLFLIIAMLIVIIPFCVKAQETEDDFVTVSETTKYYKTTEFKNEVSTASLLNNSKTVEITKEEYDAFDPNAVSPNTVVETTYKRMTSSIATNGSYYRYMNIVYWKSIPKVRSYDIIGIGHYASVKVKGDLKFTLAYTTSAGKSYTSNTFEPNINSGGSSAVFKLPTDSLINMQATLVFDVQKSSSATVISQIATGDYAHATSTVTKSAAMDHKMQSNGLYLANSIYNSYDTISEATTSWQGSW